MKKIMSLYDNCKTSIRIAYIGLIFLGFGFLINSSSVNTIYTFSNEYFITFAKICFKIGQAIILNLPLILMINFVCKKANSGIPIALALGGYFAYLVSTMLFSTGKLDSYAYATNIGINSIFNLGDLTTYPYETGLIGSLIVGLIVRYSFLKSRNRGNNAIFYFISDDTISFIYTIVLCIIAGCIVSFIFPYVYWWLNKIISYVYKNPSNQYVLGVYGVLDRICSILGINKMSRTALWLTSEGGTYIDTLTGAIVSGDVNLWQYAQNNGVSIFGAGKYTSVYYVINLFIIPAIYFAYLHTINDPTVKHKYRFIFIAGAIVSILCGNPLPLELLLLFTAPVLLIVYFIGVFASGAAIGYFQAYVGFEYLGGSVETAMPGSIFDLIINLRTEYNDSVNKIIIIGATMFVLIYLACRFYFRYVSYDVFNNKTDKLCDQIITALGGNENIDKVSTDYLKILVYVKEFEYINYDDLNKLDIKTIKETNDYISFEVGVSNYKLYRVMRKKIK